jgi:hypothetical protein
MLSWWDTTHAASHDLFTPYMHARQLNQLWQPFNQSGCGASQLTIGLRRGKIADITAAATSSSTALQCTINCYHEKTADGTTPHVA